jgi:hypothetical protein
MSFIACSPPDRKETHWESGNCSGTDDDRLDPSIPEKRVSDLDHLKIFVAEATADTWLTENDPEGMAFEYEVLE